MAKYIFKRMPDSEHFIDTLTITVESEAESWDQLIKDFSSFLAASGFVLPGRLDVVEGEGEE